MTETKTTRLSFAARARTVAPALAGLALACFAGPAAAQDGARGAGEVTFTGDVAPILQESCQSCHREGAIAARTPLLTYEDAKRLAPLIRLRVAARDMPPYQYDPDVGVQALQHDMRLSRDEIDTVVRWVDQGAPRGDPAATPPPREFPDPAEWRLAERYDRPPDVVIPARPYTVPAEGSDKWWEPMVKIPIEDDRWIQAIEVKPSVEGRMVVHHANTDLLRPNADGELEEAQAGSRFTEYAAGKLGEVIPEGAGRLLPADGYVQWSIHYYPMGEEVEDEVTELGFWLHPEGYDPEYIQDLDSYALDGNLLIPPHRTGMAQGFHSFDHPVRIDSYQPHGHLRLRGASMEIYYPETGEREVVSMISDWSTWWQHSHIYEPDAAPLVPAGAVLILTHWYDNTENNPNNPDPEQWVYPGGRTGDEMAHDWIAVSHLSQEQYERLQAERERRLADEQEGDGDDG